MYKKILLRLLVIILAFLAPLYGASGKVSAKTEQQYLTRAQFLEKILEVIDFPSEDDFGDNSYYTECLEEFYTKDVQSTSQEAKILETSYCNDIIQGYPDGTIRPNAVINRAEVSQILFNIEQTIVHAQSEARTKQEHMELRDVAPGDWFYNPVYFTINFRLFDKTSANTFSPENFLTLSEANTLIEKFSELFNNGSREYTKKYNIQLEEDSFL